MFSGVSMSSYTQAEGAEMTITVNVISTFLLALNLLPILRKSGEKTGVTPHLVITSSEVHAWVSLHVFRGLDRWMNMPILQRKSVGLACTHISYSSHLRNDTLFYY